MSDFKPSSKVKIDLASEIVGGAKVPHTTSQPLLRMRDDKVVIAAFAFLFSAEDMRAKVMPRPTLWLVADIETGAVIERLKCSETDFSAQPFDGRYSISWEPPQRFDAQYFEEAYAELDEVRRGYVTSGVLDVESYERYFNTILSAVPPEYRVFYSELGGPRAL
jgi:hypothetical protein